MVRPQAVIEVADVVPEEHQQQTVQELAVLKRQREYLYEAYALAFRVREFLGAGLHRHVDDYKEEREKENSKFAGEKKDISFGSQIRSYVFQPYTMVKDHRTKYSVGNIQGVMDGDIDGFLDEFLSAKWKDLPSSSDDDGDDL